MTSASDPQLAQVKVHPAVIVMGCWVGSLFGRETWHLNLAPENLLAFRYMGIAFEIAGVAVLLVSYGSMARAKTTINPSERSSIAVAMMLLLYWAVILEEEAYLERKFGDEYLSYKKRVRRWL